VSLLKALENTQVINSSGMLIATTNGKRTAKEWAILATNKILDVADNAPQPIRDQALQFQGRILSVIENYIQMAIDEQKAFMLNDIKNIHRGVSG